jgi:hypothetical protein
MSLMSSADQRSTVGLHSLEQYEPLIGAATAERFLRKTDRVRTMRVAHVSSTFHDGGVTEILTPADVDDKWDRHRDRLASDPGHARLLQLHENSLQRAAG